MTSSNPAAIPYRILLALLAGLFASRVLLQFALEFHELSFLPGFELWHSNLMPYSTLLTLQCVILVMLVAGVFYVPPKRARPSLGNLILTIGWLYVAAMLIRTIIGTFNLNSHAWFDGSVSTAFHFLLAFYLLVFGSAVKGACSFGDTPSNSPLLRYLAYPVVMGGGYLLYIWLVQTGSPMLFSAYLSVLVAVFAILLHETFAPIREDWRPSVDEVVSDGIFLTLVQIALPAILKGLALFLIVMLAQSGKMSLQEFWPHDFPVIVQVLIMLIVAEFFRYWLHRTLHTNGKLWKLHAVHHAAEKLYTVNVGRFHPFDKSLQFLGDTLPFLLLGVSAEVFATYFVLYAINGFYQHSNSDLKLGPLNWLIAGPELHRWHHSAKVSEAHSNYGNNLIIWDAIFGTRYLPRDRQVGRVGIGNTDWPNGFLQQMTAPFTTSTESPSTSVGK